MTSWTRTLVGVLAVALVMMLGACSSGSDSSANMRVVNATKATTVNVTANGSQIFGAVAPLTASSFAGAPTGSQTYSVASTTGSTTSFSVNYNLAGGVNYTLLVYESQGTLRAALLVENQTTPLTGYGTLNVANVSSDPGALDVYVVPPGTKSIVGLGPTFPNTTGTTMASTLAAGIYDVIATAAGNSADLRFKLSNVVVASQKIQTLALTGSTGGMLVNGILITQNGPVTFSPTTYSRVRAVSGLPASAAAPVVVQVGAQALTPVYAPNPGAYTLVTGGTTSYTITVNGAPVGTLPAATFATGSDYTIVVYGTVADPKVAILTDDNHQAVGGQTNLRLVNGSVNAVSGVTMYVNNVGVATSIGYGAASPYVGTISSGVATIQLVQAAAPTVTSTNVQLISGGVYTVFVLDASLTPYVVKDR